ncbi:MAG TPA: 1-acylglycerol-3-phosphate O-acyltransferase, partial [Anaeromyxobacteraceae bacterium]|nr:1-acylglycerol-3-phosphate O-acyltransferase [Anaeromyxobacteraceae bacterium]
MRAMVMESPGRPLTAAELPVPVPGPGQVRVAVRACGVCRTDLHVLDGDLPFPGHRVVPGHEVVGVVEAAGPGAARFRAGDRVGIPWLGSTCGTCEFCVTGRENLPWRGAAVIVANHLSLADVIVLYGLFRPFKWVSKASVFRVPFLGWNMTLNGYVALVRGNADSVRKMLARCQELLAQGNPILLFPEGTRSATGELQPFKDGAFRLARDARVPVIPVVVSGTH